MLIYFSYRKVMNKSWTTEELEILKTNYPVGGKHLCKTFLPNRSLVAIWQTSRKLDLDYKYKHLQTWSVKDFDFLKENYSTKGTRYCANYLNRSVKSVVARANQLGLVLTGDFHFGKLRDFSEIFNLNNPKVVYLLGLIWADGYVGKTIVVSIISDDMDQILDRLDIHNLLIGCSVQYRKPQRQNWKPQTTLTFGNSEIISFLKENGYTKGRHNEPKILELIPKHLQHYWFRGLLDGDGSYVVAKNGKCCISLTGDSNSTYKYMQDLCAELDIIMPCSCRINKNGSKYTRVTTKNLYDAQLFCNYIYPEWDGLGLDRKYFKAQKIVSQYQKAPAQYKR